MSGRRWPCRRSSEPRFRPVRPLRRRSRSLPTGHPILRRSTPPLASVPHLPPRSAPPVGQEPHKEQPAPGGARDAPVLHDWVIGRSAEADIVIEAPVVSGMHCRLTKTADGRFWLEDLSSANGTYVNRVPIAGKVPVTRTDKITLGKRTAMPWPDDAA